MQRNLRCVVLGTVRLTELPMGVWRREIPVTCSLVFASGSRSRESRCANTVCSINLLLSKCWGLFGWDSGWAVETGSHWRTCQDNMAPIMDLALHHSCLRLWCSTMPRWNLLHLCFSVTPIDFSSTLSSTRDEYLCYPIKVMQGLRCSSLTAHLVCTGLSGQASPPTARWMLLTAT